MITNVLCHGEATGSISIAITGGTDPITYTWSNGASSATIDHLFSGEYSMTIADAVGCVDHRSFIITEPSAITITLDSLENADDAGSGLIWVSVFGGTPGYIYQWIDPAGGIQHSEDLNGLVLSGYYFLEVTDTAGCIARLDSVFLDGSVATQHIQRFTPVKIYPVPTGDVLFIDIEAPIEELIIADATGRIWKKIISPGSNKINVSDMCAGWYVLRISDGTDFYMAKFVK